MILIFVTINPKNNIYSGDIKPIQGLLLLQCDRNHHISMIPKLLKCDKKYNNVS